VFQIKAVTISVRAGFALELILRKNAVIIVIIPMKVELKQIKGIAEIAACHLHFSRFRLLIYF
jgi:hypothetical protein